MKLRHIVIPDPLFVDEDEKLSAALGALTHKRQRVMGVRRNGRLEQLITERDILEHYDPSTFEELSVGDIPVPNPPVLDPEHSLSEAFVHMSAGHNRYLIVRDQAGFEGIVGEHELIEALRKHKELKHSHVSAIMSLNIFNVARSEPFSSVLEIMKTRRISSIVISDAERPEGIFTEADALRLLGSGAYDPLEAIEHYMHSPVYTIGENCAIDEAEEAMERYGVRHLVVTDQGGRTCGVITQHDLFKGVSAIYLQMLEKTVHVQAETIKSQHHALGEKAVLDHLLHALPESFLIAFDQKGKVFYRTPNPFPYSGECAEVGDNIYGFSECKLLEIVRRYPLESLRKAPPSFHYVELMRIERGGGDYLVQTSLSPIRDKDGRPRGYLFFAQDQSEAIKTREHLQFTQYSVEHATIAIFWIAPEDGSIVYANKAACDSLGYTFDELSTLGVLDFDPDFDTKRWEKHSRELERKRSLRFTSRHRRKDGTLFPVEIYANLVSYGGKQYNMAFVADLSERRQTQEELEFARHCLDVASFEIFWVDREGRIVYMNDIARAKLGYTPEEAKTLTLYDVGPNDDPKTWNDHFDYVKSLGKTRFETTHRTKDGETYPAEVYVNHMEYHDKELIVGFARDITEIKKTRQELEYLGQYDPLTGLPNRLLLTARLEHALQSAKRSRKKIAVCFIDLDNFKYINDAFSHATGDLILKETGERIQQRIRQEDTVARFGSDEFVVVLDGIADGLDANRVMQEIMGAIEEPFVIEGVAHVLSASIGISLYPDDSDGASHLIRYADTAKHRAKEEGKHRVSFYTVDMMNKIQEKILIEQMVVIAMQQQEFELYYQPQVDLASNRVIGLEALIRWKHPLMGLIAPDKFIPTVEENKQIIPLGTWVLREACTQMVEWLENGTFSGTIAINVSAVQLNNPDFVDVVKEVLEATSLPPHHLEIEVTESALMDNIEYCIDVMRQINELGIRFAIDDFGTGYSSLNYLRRMPLSVLKIDKSFVDDLPADSGSCAIANTVIGLSENMRMTSLAEGIETLSQLEYLRSSGCDIGQGFYFSRPLDKKAIELFLREWQNQNP